MQAQKLIIAQECNMEVGWFYSPFDHSQLDIGAFDYKQHQMRLV